MRTLHRDATSWNGLSELRPLLVGYLGRFLRDDAEIEDTAQEALLRAARFRLHLVDPSRLRPWILRIALNVLRDRRRRECRLPRADADESLLEGLEGREEIPGDSPSDAWIELSGVVVERAAAYHHLDAAIACLGAADRGVLSDWYFEPSRGPAAADRVCDEPRRPPEKHRVFRARRRLTRALLQRFALDDRLGWPVEDGAPTQTGSGVRAVGARPRSRRPSRESALDRAGGSS